MLLDCCASPRAKEEDMKALLRLKVTRAEETRIVASSRRRFHLEALAALLVILVSAVPGDARCDPSTDPDKSDIARARFAVARNCDCSGATNHGDYVSCAAQQANAVLVNKDCAGAVERCAARSTCGKPGFVTCCRTKTV